VGHSLNFDDRSQEVDQAAIDFIAAYVDIAI
jgi:hypothetical protein